MKKLASILAIIFIPALCFPGDIYKPICTGKLTSDQQVYTGHGVITSIEVITNGTNDTTATLYDNTAASGKIIRYFKVVGADHYGGQTIFHPVKFDNGINLDIETTGGGVIIDYVPGE